MTRRSWFSPSCRSKIPFCSRNCSSPWRSAGAQSLAAVEAALATEEKTFVVVAQRDASVEQPGLDDLYTVGTQAVVKKFARGDDGVQMIVQGVERVTILRRRGDRAVSQGPNPAVGVAGRHRYGSRGAARRRAGAGGQGAVTGAAADADRHPPTGGPGRRSAAADLPLASMLSLDVRQGAGAAGGPDPHRGAAADPRLSVARGAGAGAAQEDQQLGRDGDDQAAARIHAPPADAGHSGGTG